MAHGGFGFGDLQDGAVADLGLDSLDEIDHAVERGIGKRGEVAGFAEHRFFHKGIARADSDAVPAGDAARA